MAVSPVSLCNLALVRLGGTTIAALNEGSKESILCDLLFESSRDATLRDHPWNFATLRRTLASTGNPVEPWAHAYAYPVNCLFAREIVNPRGRQAPPVPFEVAGDGSGGRVIYTDLAPAVLLYTARVTDLAACDPLFLEAFSWKLAAELAMPLANNKALMDMAQGQYARLLTVARACDGNEGRTEPPEMASWLLTRTGNERAC
ncbi:hypothetical protein [Phaeospirillum tilakii]|uniref:Nucleotidyl transferase AbiEii toxin, Type IV TA system n=1 Tax=Phaeospirillum tilakii TaxID=741673 RepID=A0ABW5C9R3_9PROT